MLVIHSSQRTCPHASGTAAFCLMISAAFVTTFASSDALARDHSVFAQCRAVLATKSLSDQQRTLGQIRKIVSLSQWLDNLSFALIELLLAVHFSVHIRFLVLLTTDLFTCLFELYWLFPSSTFKPLDFFTQLCLFSPRCLRGKTSSEDRRNRDRDTHENFLL